MTLVLRYAARSDRGLVRANNEDSVYAGARLLALADGMGGHAAGEVASQLVIAALAHLDDDEPGGDLLSKLDTAVRIRSKSCFPCSLEKFFCMGSYTLMASRFRAVNPRSECRRL